MIQRLKNSLRNNNVIIKNIFSLSALQAFNYILPLLTLPYILRVIGPEKYWIIAFASAFIAYFIMIVNYGFNYSATKNISMNRNDNIKISTLFWNIIYVKLLLGIFVTLICTALIFYIDILYVNYIVLLFTLLSVLWEITFPIWLFQGMENMKYITIINVAIKTIFLAPIFLFINNESDFILIPLITSLSIIFTWILAFIVAIRVFNIRYMTPSFNLIKTLLKDWWYVFSSIISYWIYASSAVFILWIFTNNTIVWYYATAEKFLQASKMVVGIFSQSIYPSISKKLLESKEKTIAFLQKITSLLMIISSIWWIILFFGANSIISILLWNDYLGAILPLKILSLTLLVYGFNDSAWILTLLNFWYNKEFQIVMLMRTIFFMIVWAIFCYYYWLIWIVFGILFSEIFLTILLWVVLKNKQIYLISFYNKFF